MPPIALQPGILPVPQAPMVESLVGLPFDKFRQPMTAERQGQLDEAIRLIQAPIAPKSAGLRFADSSRPALNLMKVKLLGLETNEARKLALNFSEQALMAIVLLQRDYGVPINLVEFFLLNHVHYQEYGGSAAILERIHNAHSLGVRDLGELFRPNRYQQNIFSQNSVELSACLSELDLACSLAKTIQPLGYQVFLQRALDVDWTAAESKTKARLHAITFLKKYLTEEEWKHVGNFTGYDKAKVDLLLWKVGEPGKSRIVETKESKYLYRASSTRARVQFILQAIKHAVLALQHDLEGVEYLFKTRSGVDPELVTILENVFDYFSVPYRVIDRRKTGGESVLASKDLRHVVVERRYESGSAVPDNYLEETFEEHSDTRLINSFFWSRDLRRLFDKYFFEGTWPNNGSWNDVLMNMKRQLRQTHIVGAFEVLDQNVLNLLGGFSQREQDWLTKRISDLKDLYASSSPNYFSRELSIHFIEVIAVLHRLADAPLDDDGVFADDELDFFLSSKSYFEEELTEFFDGVNALLNDEMIDVVDLEVLEMISPDEQLVVDKDMNPISARDFLDIMLNSQDEISWDENLIGRLQNYLDHYDNVTEIFQDAYV